MIEDLLKELETEENEANISKDKNLSDEPRASNAAVETNQDLQPLKLNVPTIYQPPVVAEPSPTPSAARSKANKEPLFYNIKWIKFNGKKLPIILQNENGPCPLISLCNVLLLRQDLKLNANQEVILNDKLVELLADSLFNHFLPLRASRQQAAANSPNVETILNDTLGVIQKLQYGMDVNVRFSSCTNFEYTPELDMFDLFFVNLYHGWLIDPEQKEMYEKLAEKSYNQLIELMISSDDFTRLLVENFMETTASQMTYHGLASLYAVLKDDELAILFRNNHFSTIYKNPHTSQLYLLVTDNGFLTHEDIVWETLDNIDNDGRFCNSSFVEINSSGGGKSAANPSIDEKVDTTNE